MHTIHKRHNFLVIGHRRTDGRRQKFESAQTNCVLNFVVHWLQWSSVCYCTFYHDKLNHIDIICRLGFGLMFTSMLMSFWCYNTAITEMMVPIGLGILKELEKV